MVFDLEPKTPKVQFNRKFLKRNKITIIEKFP